jgi:hypothetical protein
MPPSTDTDLPIIFNFSVLIYHPGGTTTLSPGQDVRRWVNVIVALGGINDKLYLFDNSDKNGLILSKLNDDGTWTYIISIRVENDRTKSSFDSRTQELRNKFHAMWIV